jgi:WD40 repeat protein
LPAVPRDPLPAGAVARIGSLNFCHGDYLQQILTSTDGKTIITIGGRAVRVFDAATGREKSPVIRAADGRIFATGALLPGGDQLALSGYDGAIHIWDWKAHREIRSFKPALGGDREIVTASYAFAPDGRLAFLLYQTGIAPLVDLATGKVKDQLQLPKETDVVSAAAFTPDGKAIVTAGYDRTIRVWDPATGKQQRQFAAPLEIVTTLAISPDGRWLAAVGSSTQILPGPNGGTVTVSQPEKSVHVLDLAAGRESYRLDFGAAGSEGTTVLFTPDSRFLITGSADDANAQHVRQWDLATGKQVRDFSSHGGGAPAVALSRDGRTLLTGSAVVRLWDWQTGRPKLEPTGNPGAAASLTFLPDARSLVTGGNGLTVWDVATGREQRRLTGPASAVDGLALAPDGKTLAVVTHAGATRDLAVVETATGKQVRAVKAGAGYLDGPVVSPDGKLLATASGAEDSAISIWDYANLIERRRVKARLPAGMLSFSADGRTLRGIMMAVGFGAEPIPFSIDTETGKVIEHNGLAGTNLTWFCYSSDGRMLAVGGQGGAKGPTIADLHGSIQLYDTQTWKVVREITDVKSLPARMGFSPDGKRLASGGWDGAVTIWDEATGKRIREFAGHRGRIESLAFSPDGKSLASGSVDTTVLIWDVSKLEPVTS